MRPIKTDTATTLYVGPAEKGVDPLPIEESIELAPDGSVVDVLRSRWRLTDEERAAIVLGADLVLDVFGKTLPPVRPAISAPPESDPGRVFAIIDAAIARTTAISIAGLLGLVGYRTDADTVAAWSDEAQVEVARWLETVPDPEHSLRPVPAVLEELERSST